MSFELAGKIKELARIALEAKAKVDALEARVTALEAGMPSVIPESIVKRVVEQLALRAPKEQMRDRIPVAVEVPDKRKPGRPRKVE